MSRAYVGRFAPTPSGPLHAGSLVAALGSWLDARAHGGRWLVRIEDLDAPRNAAGATATILRQLERLGLRPDGDVVLQSTRVAAYRAALRSLLDRGLAYPCACSRRDLALAASAPSEELQAAASSDSGDAIAWPDGSNATATPDGCDASVRPAGRVATALSDGRGASALPDGRDASALAVGRGVTALPDGGGVTALPDGGGVTALPAGRGVTALSDGRGASALPDGRSVTALPDGRGAATSLDGRGAATSLDAGVVAPPRGAASTAERVYPGTCRAGLRGKPARSIRVRVEANAAAGLPTTTIVWRDRRLGERCEDVASAVGDFVLERADGIVAYQLAVVVDDAAQGVTDVVRGEDLAGSTPRQIVLQRLLGLPTPRWLHLPLVRGADGAKLSKQTGAAPLHTDSASEALAELADAARTLGLAPSGAMRIEPWLAAMVDVWRARWSPA